MEACPFDSTKRSRFGQIGSTGSKRMTRFHSVYTSGASAMGVPGCPDFACCTASIESVRMVLIHSWSSAVSISGSADCVKPIVLSSGLLTGGLRFEGSYLAETPQMTLRFTEICRQKSLDEIPGYGRSHGPAAHTNNVHVVVLYALPCREVVVDQPGADARYFVGANRCP